MKPLKTFFAKTISSLNGLRIESWRFEPGMLFGSSIEWWGEKKPRSVPHSGLDIQSFLGGEGRVESLNAGAKIPLIYDGEIINITKDFIGFSIFVRHDLFQEGKQLFSIYGHLLPGPGIMKKNFLSGTLIGRLADGKGRVPSHLHLSLAYIPPEIPPEKLTWNYLEKESSISFLNPLDFI